MPEYDFSFKVWIEADDADHADEVVKAIFDKLYRDKVVLDYDGPM